MSWTHPAGVCGRWHLAATSVRCRHAAVLDHNEARGGGWRAQAVNDRNTTPTAARCEVDAQSVVLFFFLAGGVSAMQCSAVQQ